MSDGTVNPKTDTECGVCRTPNPRHAKFCYECGAHLAWTAAERRIITVLFADLSGFTGLTERLDAEQVHSLITVWLDPLCEAVVRWGGHVDKFIGDCVMALFGAPVAYENEPERAVRAALDMHAAFDEEAIVHHAAAVGIGGYRPRLTIGVNTGPVVTGMFSSGGAWDYTAIGDTVNVAARLQGICEPGGILAGEATWQQTRHLFDFGDERVLQVKGRSEAVRARPVSGVREVRGQVRGFSDRKTPLVGRTPDLEQLRAHWRAVAGGESGGEARTCLLFGPAGIGKSRLVAELITAENIPAGSVARGRSYPYASSTPWEPIAELIRDLHDLGGERSAPEAVAAITNRAPRPWSEDERAGLGAVLGSPASDIERLDDLPPEERNHWMARAVARALEQGVQEPRLLVLEDLHWADRTTLDFLCSLPGLEFRSPLLLALITRPPLPSETGVGRLVESIVDRIELAPLEHDETIRLAEAILGPHELPDELFDLIFDRSGGNPLFIEEIIKTLTGERSIIGDGKPWRTTADYRELSIPDSIESVITTRIDGLDPSTRRVLQYAAIVGRRFWASVVGEALARRPVDRELGDLMDAALVRHRTDSAVPGEDEYVFEHLLLQEVAYEGLLSGMRAELHGVVAEWLDENIAVDTAEHDDWIAYHFERSSAPVRALPHLLRAIDTACERGALLDADNLIGRALAVAEAPADVAGLHRKVEEIAAAVGDDDRRLAAIERLEALGKESADPAMSADAMLRRARRLLDVGELESARDLAEQVLPRFRDLDDESSEADVLALLGRVAHLWGAYEQALNRYRAALPLERRAGDRPGEAEILRRLGLAEVDFGNFTRALDYFEQSAGIYAEIRHRPGQAHALADRAIALRWLGCYDEAEATARRAAEIAETCASRGALAAATLARGLVLGASGRTDEARGVLRELLDGASDLRRPILEAHAWLALGELESGGTATAAVQRARDVAATGGLVHIEVLGLTRLAELSLEAGETDAADRDSARALALLEAHGDIQGPDEVVYFIRSRVLAALGRLEEARAARQRARAIVRKTAEWIEDEALRRSFLENVAPNPEIMASFGDATAGASQRMPDGASR